MKREIEYLITETGQVFTPVKSKLVKNTLNEYECTIKHLGKQIYLIGYFNFNKQGYSTFEGDKINKYMILFPNDIKRVVFK